MPRSYRPGHSVMSGRWARAQKRIWAVRPIKTFRSSRPQPGRLNSVVHRNLVRDQRYSLHALAAAEVRGVGSKPASGLGTAVEIPRSATCP